MSVLKLILWNVNTATLQRFGRRDSTLSVQKPLNKDHGLGSGQPNEEVCGGAEKAAAVPGGATSIELVT